MGVDLGLKKIASLELDKKNLLLKLLYANNLTDKVKIENMVLLYKIKNLELELYVAREQINRSTSSKLDHMLSVQKSPLDKTGLGFVHSISVSETYFTNFVSSSEPPKSEIVKPVELHHLLRRLELILMSLNLRILTSLRIRSMIDLCGVVIFMEILGILTQTVSSCKL